MTLYEKFKNLDIDTSCIGLIKDSDNDGYFCTPKGATIIGSEGVDGIHYCFVRNYGETVFAVNPMSTSGVYVYPLAYTFGDFLSLILACKSAGVVEQIYDLEKNEFDELVNEQSLCDEQTELLKVIKSEFGLEPMENPYEYVKAVQGKLTLENCASRRDNYDELDIKMPDDVEWKAYMSGSFFGHDERERAGEEIRVDKHFEHIGREWLIPSVYICKKGMVVDVCYAVEREEIRKYMDEIGSDEDEVLTSGEYDDSGNPFDFDFGFTVSVNGDELIEYDRNSGFTGTSYNPFYPIDECNDLTGLKAVEHYGLDKNKGWVFVRSSFVWNTKSAPEIKNIGVTIQFDEIPVPVLEFSVEDNDSTFEFESPADGKKYTLNILSFKRFELSEDICRSIGTAFPSCVEELKYKVIPYMPKESYSVCSINNFLTEYTSTVAVGIRTMDDENAGIEEDGLCSTGVIAGADGPTVFLFSSDDDSESSNNYDETISCSQTICKPDSKSKWLFSVYKSPYKNKTVEIEI